ncbi:MAG TPA: hypothetical protein VFH04_03460 [Nitrososphaeraceae archaeon]|nr:hypothetical protein [Nitrososphaeraceae archaeon]
MQLLTNLLVILRMAELGLVDYFVIGEAVGIVATLYVAFYYSGKQMKSLSVDIQTKVLDDLGEKYLKLVERVMDLNVKSLKEGDKIPVGDRIVLEAIHTPGHTNGSMCLKLQVNDVTERTDSGVFEDLYGHTHLHFLAS